ncbi:Shikimate kinase I [Alkalibacterium sp. AK22]|uniref:shikimate kinase n=1 Tax=Alkalibacterium sp. AK22 TaxID=1229520 RepID=UPI000451E7A2|nr:shikimate kinase [Alkalibacterium sp. AK22]EXJ22698.1 Shikimate kinase I [Alkalibacterium sp. AK22]
MTNILLIGLTGSGKTTVGQALSEQLNLTFTDMDAYIEERAGQRIPVLFEKGENHFRELESKACRELAQQSGQVISTGGGAVVRQENHPWLKQDSFIIWLNRPVEQIARDIDTGHRPLLKDGVDRLYALYAKRKDLYAELADLVVDNSGSLEETLELILSQLPETLRKGDKR